MAFVVRIDMWDGLVIDGDEKRARRCTGVLLVLAGAVDDLRNLTSVVIADSNKPKNYLCHQHLQLFQIHEFKPTLPHRAHPVDLDVLLWKTTCD